MSFMKTVSVEAYHQMGAAGLLGKDTELLYGTIYKKPRKEPLECVLTSRLLTAISPVEAEGYLVRTFAPITCGDSEPEPNVSVVRGNIDDYLRAHPQSAELIIEVVVGTDEYDRSKLRAYAVAGVKEAWLVLGADKCIEVFRRPASGVYVDKRTFNHSGVAVCESLPHVVIDLDQLFRG